MPPRMRTQSVGRPAAESLRGGIGVRVGRGGRGRGTREGNDERVDDLNGQGNDQGMGANGGVEGVSGNVEGANGGAPDFSTIIAQQLQNLLPAMLAQVGNQGNVGDQIACNPKEYDGKGGAVVLTRWIKKMENVQDMSGCSIDQKVKYIAGSFVGKALMSHEMQNLETELWNHAMVGAGHAAYTDRFHELVSNGAKDYAKAVQISGALTDEAIRNRSIKKAEKRGNVGEPSKDKNGRDDNKRTRTGNAFATTANHDYRGVPRNMNPVNARNPPIRECYECGSTDHGHGNQENQARGRVFMLGVEEARQDLNIVTGTFTLNDHFTTTLFDSGADYSFVSINFIPLLGIEPSELGFRYEIEISSGQLVEIDKVIKGCRLEIKGQVFNINLISFGHGSFNMIIVMHWLSNHKAEIICHEKVVRIPLLDGKVLLVLGERPKEKERLLMSSKASDKNLEEIIMVRDFLDVFLDDLSGLPPVTPPKSDLQWNGNIGVPRHSTMHKI
uniref:Reverse transcriptase domain-containing protein n=1 Tax=Tanacetum cinerariifolium TaxID=118510 RepID=A0A6L2LKB3_TANCI|nr:hypothetical protein [Tanacetum cinerariifolium]